MKWTETSEEKQKFLNNPSKWVYWLRLEHQRRVEDLKMDYNRKMYDEHYNFSDRVAAAKAWAVEAGLISADESVLTLEKEPGNE